MEMRARLRPDGRHGSKGSWVDRSCSEANAPLRSSRASMAARSFARSVVGMRNLIAAQAVQRACPEERITVTTEFWHSSQS